jgi:acyl-CoA thioesterase FadM
MQRIKYPPIRNKIDLKDQAQVRAWSRRLRLRAEELRAVVEKVGNSVAAVTKEVELVRISRQPAAVSPIPSSIPQPMASGPAESEFPTQV